MIAWLSGTHRRILAIAILASFAQFLDGSVFNLALPAITRDLGGGLTLQQWVVDCYQLAAVGALLLLTGAVSGAIGRVGVLRFALLAFGTGSLLGALAPSGGVLMAARAVQGLGAAFLVPGSLALITSNFASDRQPRAIGVWSAWTGTAFVLGPPVGGLIVDMLSWRWIFIVSAAPMAVTFALSFGVSSVRRQPIPVDFRAGMLASVGLTATVFALIEMPPLGPRHPAVVSALVVGLVCLAGFVFSQLRSSRPTVPMHLFAIRNFGIGTLTTAFIFSALSMADVVVVLFLQEVEGFTATQAGIATLASPILSLLLAPRVGALSARWGPRVFMAAGPLVAALGFMLMRPAPAGFNFWLQMLPGLVLFGLGLTITLSPLTSTVLAAVGPGHGGVASAINNATSRTAALMAIAFIGVLAAGAIDYDSFRRLVIVTAALLTVGGLVAAIGIRNPVRSTEPVEPQAIT